MNKLRRLKFKEIVKVGDKVKIKTLAEHEMEITRPEASAEVAISKFPNRFDK